MVIVKVAVSHAVRHQLMTPQQRQESKQQHSTDVGKSKDPSSNRNASFKKETPAGEGTTLTAKTPSTGGSVWKSYKSGRKRSHKYCIAVNVAFLLGVGVKAYRDLATLHGTLSRQMSVLIMNPLSGLLSHW